MDGPEDLKRPAPPETTGLTAAPGRVRRPPPAVLPQAPIGGFDPAVRVYSTAPSTYDTHADEKVYRTRRLVTTGVLLVLAIVLRWAVGSLGEGFSDFLDLFRGSPPDLPGL